MTELLKNLLLRELAPQRTVSLFKDQEELIGKINDQYGVNIKLASLIREGVDVALKELIEQLNKK